MSAATQRGLSTTAADNSIVIRPGYKRTELGTLPQDWTVERLDSFGSGTIPPVKAGPFGSSLTRDTYVPTGYKVYGQEQVIRGDCLFGDYFITLKKFRELESCAVRPGDVLLSLVGTVGRLLEIPERAPEGIINPRLIRFSFDKNRILPRFFRYLFESDQVQDLLARKAQGGTMGVLNAGALRPFLIPLPALSEQCAIAEALSDVDRLLGALDALIAKKQSIKQAAMHQLLTGKTRLPGFSGPWEARRLGDVIDKLIGGGTPSRSNPAFWGDEIPWITVKDFATFHPEQTQESITRAGLNASASHLIPAGTLITSTRMALGRAAVFGVDVAINQDLKAVFVRPNTSVTFLFYWFECNAKMIEDLGSGSTVKGISIAQLTGLPFPGLSIKEQTSIATVLSDIDSEIAALERRRYKTRAIKEGMMQQLLTGRVRLAASGSEAAPC